MTEAMQGPENQDWLDAIMPPIQNIELRSEPDYYGASYLVAEKLNKRRVPMSYASWMHGWGGPLPLRHAKQLVFAGSKKNVALVHTSEQKDFLKNNGFGLCHAVGMPFLYARESIDNLPRRKNTLLVMPPHISKFVAPKFDENRYVSEICDIAGKFDQITVCISGECERQGRWRKSFNERGISVVIGADIFDRNALRRMATLFSSFDVVTSPNLGSHLVYASLCGCRVSLWGEVSRPQRMELLSEPYYQRNPDLLEFLYSDDVRQWQERIKKQFVCEPGLAESHEAWAQGEAGLKHMRRPEELARLLGWSPMTQFRRRILAFPGRLIEGGRRVISRSR